MCVCICVCEMRVERRIGEGVTSKLNVLDNQTLILGGKQVDTMCVTVTVGRVPSGGKSETKNRAIVACKNA